MGRRHETSKESTMRGRIVDLGVLLALSFLCVSWTAAEAQPAKRVPTIGGLSGGVPPSEAQSRQAPCWPARHERSWVEGQHSTVERRDAEGPRERLQGLAAELVQLPVDVILATGPQAARAAQAAADTSPIVFMAAGDPGRAGLVARLAHPGGNMTGLSAVSPELSEKRLALLKEAAPGSSRVAVLPNADVN
jgi:putative ABC transport system substrate-binding protein